MSERLIAPGRKVLRYPDVLAQMKRGDMVWPLHVEMDLSNRCNLRCAWCLTEAAEVHILGVGERSIAEVLQGDHILAWNEATGSVVWSEVKLVSYRRIKELIYRVAVAHSVVEATGNHEFWTDQGWKPARELRSGDAIGVIATPVRLRVWPTRDMEQGHLQTGAQQRNGPRRLETQGSESVCLRLRGPGEDAWPCVLQGPLQSGPKVPAAFKRADEGAQPDVGACNGSQSSGESASRYESANFGCRESILCERRAPSAGNIRGWAATHPGQNDATQPDARPGGSGEGARDTERKWLPSSLGSAEGVLAESRVSPGPVRSDEAAQSYPDSGCARREYQTLAADGEAVQSGNVVHGIVPGCRFTDLVHGGWPVLGVSPQSGLQGAQPADGDRTDGRLADQAEREAQPGELRGADARLLQPTRVCLPGVVCASPPETTREGQWSSTRSRSGVRDYGPECNLRYCRVDSVDVSPQTATVFNLETDSHTFFANGLLVHNCDFVYMHDGAVMSLALARKILDELAAAGVQAVTFTGGGEPTMNPEFVRIVRIAWANGLKVGLYTNGVYGTRILEVTDALTWVYVSLDAVTPAAYAAAKGTPGFWPVVNTIQALTRCREGDAPALGIGYLLSADNYEDAPAMARLTDDLGADYCQFRPLVGLDDYGWVSIALPLLASLAGPRVYVSGDRFRDLEAGTPRTYSVCRASALVPCVGADGTLWVCPNTRGLRALGDLRTTRFADLWQARPEQLVGSDCRVACRNHALNETLEYMCGGGPHDAFV